MNGYFILFADATAVPQHWLEQLSQIANIVLAIAALLALWQLRLAASQIKLSRSDIQLRSRRESIAIALDQCKRFAHEIVPHTDLLNKEMMGRKYPLSANVDPTFPFIPKDADPLVVQIWVNEVELRVKIVQLLNELESFAMYFASELADESLAFTPTAATFCYTCEYYRFFIGFYRQPDKMKLYQNLVKLYSIWKPRVERTVLEEQQKLLESKKQKLPADKKGTPLGTDFK
jgi:hypothetical protein